MIFFSYFLKEEQHAKSIEEFLTERTNIQHMPISKNSYIYDTHGDVIAVINKDMNRHYLPFEDIPNLVTEAFIATEDQDFFVHEGIDGSAVIRAFLVNAKAQTIEEGGSTITQQVARNVFLSHEQTYHRKLKEVLYAYVLEKEYSKEKILELYINTMYFQHGLYGFETASQVYFGKSSHELSLAETAFLAAIPANPSHYDPLTNKDQTHARQEWVLEKMKHSGVISETEKQAALNEDITIKYTKQSDAYPAYTTYIEHELKQLIAREDGYIERFNNVRNNKKKTEKLHNQLNERVREVLQSGVHIETSLDPAIQKKAVTTAHTYLHQWQIEGAVVIIDHIQHDIIAVTAGKNYQKYDFHRGFQAYRQPGSTFKPLLVYGPFIDQKNASIYSTVQTDRFCKNGYCPANAGGHYVGRTTLENALAYSYNTASVRLLEETGIQTAFSYLKPFNFSQIGTDDYHYSAALGGLTHGVTPMELTKAYTVFSQGGQYIAPTGIQQVKDESGHVLYEQPALAELVWNKETNDKLRSMLYRVVERGTGQGVRTEGKRIGGKTGTTNNVRDLWFVGFTDRYTMGVWVGHDDSSPMTRIQASQPHIRLWKDIVPALD